MNRVPAILLLIAAAIAESGCSAPVETFPRNPAIDPIVQPYAEINDFHGLVAVATGGKLVSLNTYGFADVNARIRHTAATPFLVGSISKQLTAGVILKLQEAGMLATRDTLSQYLPDYPRGDEITIHHLLTHRAGIPDIYSATEFFALRSDSTSSLDEMVAALGRMPLTFYPGSAYAYSNGGYALLAKLIEEVTGGSYGIAVQTYVVDALGLRETGHLTLAESGIATGYDPRGERGLAAVSSLPPGVAAGSGSIVSSARDLAVWMDAVQKGSYLTAASRHQMLTDHGDGYGYGLSVYTYADTPVWEHDGRVAGWSSDIAYYGAIDTTVIILSNVQSTLRDRIRNEMADLLFARPLREYEMRPTTTVDVDAHRLDVLAGTYSFGPGFAVHVRVGDGALLLRANQGDESDFFPVESNRFFSRMLYASVRFSTPPDTMFYGTGSNEFAGVRTQ